MRIMQQVDIMRLRRSSTWIFQLKSLLKHKRFVMQLVHFVLILLWKEKGIKCQMLIRYLAYF